VGTVISGPPCWRRRDLTELRAGYRNGGEPVWVAKAGSSMFGTPTISDNAVLIGSGNHGLYVLTHFGLPMT
jgi:putative pyrroloquinoline-quinone-binding quinoprotein